MRVIGIDEAGYGPLLGPLVVSAVGLDLERHLSPRALWDAVGDRWGIADSKQVLSHGNMAQGEETVLALLGAAGVRSETRGGLFEQLVVAPVESSSSAAQPADAMGCGLAGCFFDNTCGADQQPIPRWGSRPAPSRIDDLRRRLEQVGARVAWVRAVALCPGRFNQGIARGLSKADINWSLFSQMIRLAHPGLASDGLTLCDKLGGRTYYGTLLADFGLSAVVEQGAARSAYDVEGLGRVEFLRRADSIHLPVAMASMIAKLVREHVLDQWHGVLARQIPGLKPCSGYHDPVTRQYILRTESVRRALEIPEGCFIRSR